MSPGSRARTFTRTPPSPDDVDLSVPEQRENVIKQEVPDGPEFSDYLAAVPADLDGEKGEYDAVIVCFHVSPPSAGRAN